VINDVVNQSCALSFCSSLHLCHLYLFYVGESTFSHLHLVCKYTWIGNERMPKISSKWLSKFIFKLQSCSILLISNHDSFRVVFDKIASVYFIWKIYLYLSIGNGQPREPALCQLYRHIFVPYDCFSGSSRVVGQVCACMCIGGLTSDLDIWRAGSSW